MTTSDGRDGLFGALRAAGLSGAAAAALASMAATGATCREADYFWNFDEGRDWHNAAPPFPSGRGATALAATGDAGATLCGGAAWASGREAAGVGFDGAAGTCLRFTAPLEGLGGDATVSFWVRTDAARGVLFGEEGDPVLVRIGADGRLAVAVGGGRAPAVASRARVDDGAWHFASVTRTAATGAVALRLDGGPRTEGAGPRGVLPRGCARAGHSGFAGVLDELRVFGSVLTEGEEDVLFANSTPLFRPQDALVASSGETEIGSVLMPFAFDPDGDRLFVARFSQPASGSCRHLGDGVFAYTPGRGFGGRDAFRVWITDRRGGHATALVRVHDARFAAKAPVVKFHSLAELPLPEEAGARVCPAAFDADGDGRPDLVVATGGRAWLYRATGDAASPLARPAPLEEGGRQVEATALSLMRVEGARRLVVREADGRLRLLGGREFLRGPDGRDVVVPEPTFACGDWDNDGEDEILCAGSEDVRLLSGERVVRGSYNLTPSFADLNGDGRTDLVIGDNWGGLSLWTNCGGSDVRDGAKELRLSIVDAEGVPERLPDGRPVIRPLDGAMTAFADFDGDGTLDMVLGGTAGRRLLLARGTPINAVGGNLRRIEAEVFGAGDPETLGLRLCADGERLLSKYRALMGEWSAWAADLPTPAERASAAGDLERHVGRHPFLRWGSTKETAWVRRDKAGRVEETGPMYQVPGLMVSCWNALHHILPDSPRHRARVADTMGLRGLLREVYLESGLVVAENAKASDAQLQTMRDFFRRFPRICFPDDILSVDCMMNSGSDGIAHFYVSGKNTFGSKAPNIMTEFPVWMKEIAEARLGPGSVDGDYFTLVMGHEVCHSLDAYVVSRANAELARRWFAMVVNAANNGGREEAVIPQADGWFDLGKTKELWKAKGRWDGVEDWETAWKRWWRACPYSERAFLRGSIGWFLGARGETLATQANQHFTGSEGRFAVAEACARQGNTAPLEEVFYFVDVISAGLNAVPFFTQTADEANERVVWHVSMARLERDERGEAVALTVNGRRYERDAPQ